MKLTMITGLASMLLLAISCKKENALITNKVSAPALATDMNEAGKYTSVPIHGQQWMTTNLAVTHYRNGDRIPEVSSWSKWDTLTTGAWCWYNNDSATGAPYGRLYNWYAVHDPRGLAPTGWHIPSDAEWDTLQVRLGNDPGGKMKQTGTAQAGTGLWGAPNTGATNSSHFTALPGGRRFYYNGSNYWYDDLGLLGFWWSSTEDGNYNAFKRILKFNTGKIYRQDSYRKVCGLSVRCIRN